MGNRDLAKYWRAFLHWNGWKVFAAFWVKAWRITVGWTGWKRIFGLPFFLVAVLCVICGAGLIWVFIHGLEQSVPAYLLYTASAYGLTALCVKLPAALRGGKQWLAAHPRVKQFLENEEIHFTAGLYFEQVVNFGYGIFKTASGVIIGSAWIGCDGIYNLTQALIQLFQILRRRKAGSMEQQWRSYRFCGWLILLMHLTLTGIVFQMVNWNRAEEQGQIMVIATATFAFYKFVSNFIDIAKDRRHTHPVDSSVRMLNLSQAFFAIFSLQASLLHTFGTGESWEHLLNLITGCAVCLMVVSVGIYMIRRGNRQIRELREKNYG